MKAAISVMSKTSLVDAWTQQLCVEFISKIMTFLFLTRHSSRVCATRTRVSVRGHAVCSHGARLSLGQNGMMPSLSCCRRATVLLFFRCGRWRATGVIRTRRRTHRALNPPSQICCANRAKNKMVVGRRPGTLHPRIRGRDHGGSWVGEDGRVRESDSFGSCYGNCVIDIGKLRTQVAPPRIADGFHSRHARCSQRRTDEFRK